jgi:hypothetical protein
MRPSYAPRRQCQPVSKRFNPFRANDFNFNRFFRSDRRKSGEILDCYAGIIYNSADSIYNCPKAQALRTCPVIKREAGFGAGGHDARRRDKAMRDIGAERQRRSMAARIK